MFLSVRTSKNNVSFSQTSKNDVSFSQDFKKRCFFQSPPWLEKLDSAPSAWAGNVRGSSFQLCSHWCLHAAFCDHSSPEAQDDRNSARSTSARSALQWVNHDRIMIELGLDWWKLFPKEAHPVKSNLSIQEGVVD